MTFDLNAARQLHDRSPYGADYCTTCQDGMGNMLVWPCATAVALGATGRSEWLGPSGLFLGPAVLDITKLDEAGQTLSKPLAFEFETTFENVDTEALAAVLDPERAAVPAAEKLQREAVDRIAVGLDVPPELLDPESATRCGDWEPDGKGSCVLEAGHSGWHDALFGRVWSRHLERCGVKGTAVEETVVCGRQNGHPGPHLDHSWSWGEYEPLPVCGMGSRFDELTCVLEAGHSGDHEDRHGGTWNAEDEELPEPLEPRFLDCGWCYEEDGEEVHPHPECPIGRPEEPESMCGHEGPSGSSTVGAGVSTVPIVLEPKPEGTCEKLSPRGQYVCTLAMGHIPTLHQAGERHWWPDVTCGLRDLADPGRCVLEAGHPFMCRIASAGQDPDRCNDPRNQDGSGCALPLGHSDSHASLTGWRWQNEG